MKLTFKHICECCGKESTFKMTLAQHREYKRIRGMGHTHEQALRYSDRSTWDIPVTKKRA